ncbi:hypothetical protein AAE478_009608 [Parahypoxylon ruwenzoriense]
MLLPGTQAQMKVSSFDGDITKEELESFNDFVATLQPGHSEEQTKAIGLVYQLASQQTTLDQMLRFCDAVLSQRNDMAKVPTGQHNIWTGRIDPVWPNDVTKTPIQTSGEQGDPVGHLASCAYLILKTDSLHNQKVTIGDPHKYGATYMDRARTYLKEADFAMNLSNGNKMYFAKDAPYMGGKPVPWNQQMMFNYAFLNLCNAHRLLGDNAQLIGKYKSIIVASLDLFFHGGGVQTKKSSKGNPIYDWGYTLPKKSGQDSNHGSLDVAGFYSTYIDGNYGITADRMKPFANMFVDVMTPGNKKWAGSVDGKSGDGHASATNYIRSGYLFFAEFRPDAYKDMMSADLTVGKTTKSADQFSRFL